MCNFLKLECDSEGARLTMYESFDDYVCIYTVFPLRSHDSLDLYRYNGCPPHL